MRVDWAFIAKLKRKLKVPLIVKGIATAEDAALALENGVDVVYVSNHGGRQLDHGRGAMDILPEVASTVRGKAEIIVDGGFMRGTDILKALAMGAKLVGLGRLQALALAAAGREGVVRMLELLEAELEGGDEAARRDEARGARRQLPASGGAGGAVGRARRVPVCSAASPKRSDVALAGGVRCGHSPRYRPIGLMVVGVMPRLPRARGYGHSPRYRPIGLMAQCSSQGRGPGVPV